MERIPLPARVNLRNIYWTYAVPIVFIHIVAIAGVLPYLFTWSGLFLCLMGIHIFGKFITICYHRQLSHRSFKTPKWLERIFVMLSLCSLQDTPAQWVANHRQHHKHSDEQPDPHSPFVNFFWSHVGWLLVANPETQSSGALQKYARDILEDPFYMRLERYPWLSVFIYAAHAALYMAGGFALGYWWDGTVAAGVQVSLSWLMWGVLLRTIGVWHITWSVNSLTHIFGYRNYETSEGSRNNWFVALLTFGEGWHNNHHYDQAAASVQHKWWEYDFNYHHIKALELVGLAWDVIPPKHKREEVSRAAREAKAAARQESSETVTS